MTDSVNAPLTVIMPAYNEEGSIEAAVTEVLEDILDGIPGARLTVINDGSRDNTATLLARLASNDSRIEVINQKNSGHGRALRTGLDRACSECLLLLDSDRQIPVENFRALWKLAPSCDVIMGVRASRKDSCLRLVFSRIVHWVIYLFFQTPLKDANVPFKLIRRSLWLRARPAIPEKTLAPSLFLAIFGRAKGFAVLEVEVSHRARTTGTSSLHSWNFIRFCLTASWQLVYFRWRLKRA